MDINEKNHVLKDKSKFETMRCYVYLKPPGINPRQPVGKGREKKKKKNPGINHGQPAGKGRGKKKNPGINPGQPTGKGRKKKKNPGINPGQPAGKGQKKKTLVLTAVVAKCSGDGFEVASMTAVAARKQT
jgi:hypothetical protein